MKKRVSFLLFVLVFITICSFSHWNVYGAVSVFTGCSGSPNDDSLYDDTNTFAYNGPNLSGDRSYEYFDTSSSTGNTVSSTNPQITVLTHGLRGRAYHWSNNGTSAFAHDSTSLISRLDYELSRNSGTGANVYWAVMKTKTSFELYDLKDTQNKYNTGEYKRTNTTNEIEDISKHIIIIFEATDEGREGYNYRAYEEFNYMLSKIVYDVKKLNGEKLPKINLIGHSRGGLTNLEYALDHPLMVDSVFSLGTPYFGSNTASTIIGKSIADCIGVNDIISRTVYLSYYDRWDANRTLYESINYHAIGGYSDSDFLFDVFIDSNNLSGNTFSATALNVLKYGVKMIPAVFGTLNNTAELADFFYSLLKGINYTQSEVESWVQIFTDIKYTSWDINSNYWNNVWYIFTHDIPANLSPYFMNDLLVNLTSQAGIDQHSNIIRDYGFIKYQKLYTDYEHTPKKLSMSYNPAVVHNLEARDDDLISYILSNINIGVNSSYIYEVLGNNNVKITGYTGGTLPNTVYIPTIIDGYTVVSIGSNLFHDCGDNVICISIPDSITTIDDDAFIGMESLEEVSLSYLSSLSTIGNRAFAGCSSLNKFGLTQNYLTIPSCLISVGDYAFYGTNFTNIAIDENVSEIGNFAFADMDSLQGITVDSNNDYFFSNNGVLYDYDGYMIKYPSANSQTSYTIPSQISGTYIVGIREGAFMGAENLTTINLGSSLEYIGNNAFEGCLGLLSISIPSLVDVIHPFTFLNCMSLATVTLGNNLQAIERSAFEGCESLEEIEIPSSALNIESGAFKGCSSLELVTVNRYQTPLTTLGIRAFNDCSNLLVIEVPDNRLGHYKNATGWSSYRTSIVPKQNNITTYYLSTSTDLDLYDNISAGCNKLYKLIVNTKSYYDFNAYSSNSIKIELYNSSFVLIKSSSVSFTELLNNGSTYYLNIEYTEPTYSGTIHTSIERNDAHFHTYMYSWYNYTQHQKYCSCGDSTLEVHAVSAANFGHQQYAICLICGGQASIGIVGPMGNNTYPYTENGSFILPNGVVVLVDQDVNAYMEGTLEFNYPGDIMSGVNNMPFILKREYEFY